MVSLDPGIHSSKLCARNESMKFDIVWEDCIQEETRVENRESLLKEDDQALATHTKRRGNQPNFKKGNKREYQPPRKFQKTRESLPDRDFSGFQCFHCDKIRHIASNCPMKKQIYKKKINNNKRHHAQLKMRTKKKKRKDLQASKQEKKMQKSMYYSQHSPNL